MLGILAFLGLLVIGFGGAIALGLIRFDHVDPFAQIAVHPATQPAPGQSGMTAAVPAPDDAIPEPPPVIDKTIMLKPEDARLIGRNTRVTEFMQTVSSRFERRQTVMKIIGGWNSPDDGAEWTVNLPKPGKYTVSLDYASGTDWSRRGGDPGSPVGGYEVKAGDATIAGQLSSTRSLRSFELVDVGTLTLPQGEIHITLRPTSKTATSLMHLRSLRLFPPD